MRVFLVCVLLVVFSVLLACNQDNKSEVALESSSSEEIVKDVTPTAVAVKCVIDKSAASTTTVEIFTEQTVKDRKVAAQYGDEPYIDFTITKIKSESSTFNYSSHKNSPRVQVNVPIESSDEDITYAYGYFKIKRDCSLEKKEWFE